MSTETAAGSVRASSEAFQPCFAAWTPRGEAGAREDTDWVMGRCWSPPGTQPLRRAAAPRASVESGHGLQVKEQPFFLRPTY